MTEGVSGEEEEEEEEDDEGWQSGDVLGMFWDAAGPYGQNETHSKIVTTSDTPWAMPAILAAPPQYCLFQRELVSTN